MNTKHTDSVDHWDTFIDELEPFNVPPQVMNRLCSHFLTTLQTTHQQQVEEAVRTNTVIDEQLIEIAEMIANGNAFDKESGLIWQHIIDEAKRLCLLKEAPTPNHQD